MSIINHYDYLISNEMKVLTLETTTKLFIYLEGRTNHLGSNPFHTEHRSVKLILYLSNQTTIFSSLYIDKIELILSISQHFLFPFRKELNVFQQLKRTKSKLK